jgi:hypothetical protein
MGLNIKNQAVEELARQIAAATGETKTEAIRKALMERRDRLGIKAPESAMREMECTLRAIHGNRQFEPVRKEEWDRLHE